MTETGIEDVLVERLDRITRTGYTGLADAAGVLVRRAQRLSAPRSIAQLGLTAEEVAWLRRWAKGLGPMTAQGLRRDTRPVHGLNRGWTHQAGFGLLLTALAAEVVRRVAGSHELWPVVADCFEERSRTELFGRVRPPGPLQAVREAIEKAAQLLELRHAFDRPGRQQWYATIQLQFGLRQAHLARLPHYLTGNDRSLDVLQDLLDRTQPATHSRSFARVWRALRRLRAAPGSGIPAELRPDLLEGGWIVPEWLDDLARWARAERELPDRAPESLLDPGLDRPSELPTPAETGLDPGRPESRRLIESCRLEWEPGGEPCWRIEVAAPDALGLGGAGSLFRTQVRAASTSGAGPGLTWIRQPSGAYHLWQGEAQLTCPASAELSVELLDEGEQAVASEARETLPFCDGFALFGLPRGEALTKDDVLPRNLSALAVVLAPPPPSEAGGPGAPPLRLELEGGRAPQRRTVAGLQWFRLTQEQVRQARIVTARGELVWSGAEDAAPASVARGVELSPLVSARFAPDAKFVARQRAERRARGWEDGRPGLVTPGVLTIEFPRDWQPRLLTIDRDHLAGRVETRAAGRLVVRVDELPAPRRATGDGWLAYELRLLVAVGDWIRSVPVPLRVDGVGAVRQTTAGWRAQDPLAPLAWTSQSPHERVRVYGHGGQPGRLHEGPLDLGPWAPGGGELTSLRRGGEPLEVRSATRRVRIASSVIDQRQLRTVTLEEDERGRWLDVWLANRSQEPTQPGARHQLLVWTLPGEPHLLPAARATALPGPRWRLPWSEHQGGRPHVVALAAGGVRLGVFYDDALLRYQGRALSPDAARALIGTPATEITVLGRGLRLAFQRALVASAEDPLAVRRLAALLRWLRAPLCLDEVRAVVAGAHRQRSAEIDRAWSAPEAEVQPLLPEGLRFEVRPDPTWPEVVAAALASGASVAG